MGYFEETAMERGFIPVGIYQDGRTWKYGKPVPYKKPKKSKKGRKRSRSPSSPSRRDKIMGYLEGKAMDRGLVPAGIYADGRTWKHGRPTSYTTRKS